MCNKFTLFLMILLTRQLIFGGESKITFLDSFDQLQAGPRIELEQPVKMWAARVADFQIAFDASVQEPRIVFNFPKSIKPQVYRQVLYRAKSKNGKPLGKMYDILVPLYADNYGYFSENARQKRTRTDESYWWVDLQIAEDAVPGKLEISYKLYDGSTKLENGKLQVEIFATPEKKGNFLISLNEYGDKYLKPYEDKLKSDNLWQIEKSYYRFARDHHAVLNALPYKSQSGKPRKGMVPKVKDLSTGYAEVDWSDFDKRYKEYFNGLAFSDGKPVEHFYLSFNPEFPASFNEYIADRSAYEKKWFALAKAYSDHFQKMKWKDTDFYVYLNQKPAKNNSVRTNFDEPKSMADYQMLHDFHQIFSRAFKDTGPLHILFRLDISHFFCDQHIGHPGKDFRVNGGFDLLKDIEVWAISNHALKSDIAMDHALDLINHGKQVWRYGKTPEIGQTPVSIFKKVYRDRAYNLSGFVVWKSMNRKMDKGTGKDFIFYQGQKWGIAGPLPSRRLKWLRDAALDAEMLASEDLRIGKCYNKLSDIGSRGELVSLLINAKNGILPCVQ